MDFFKLRNEELGKHNEVGTPEVVAKFKRGTPGQLSSPPARQPARRGDKLNTKMGNYTKITQKEIGVKNSFSEEKKDPCWKGYKAIGMKKKGGKSVPNCVPVKEYVDADLSESIIQEMQGANMDTRQVHSHLKKGGWSLTRTSGGHDVFTHPDSENHISVPRHKQLKAPLILGILKTAKTAKPSKPTKPIEEAKKAPSYNLYHKDFSGAMQHAYDHAKTKYGITIHPDEIDNKVAIGPKKPSSGKTNSYRLKGDKGTIQVQVANLDNKRYELNMYKESLDKKANVGDYVSDFKKSDAPQFKGKTKKERQKMAVAAFYSSKKG
jgi:predicted RNA binding protein YcfA (HicA-like mRNA interferase family)